MNTVKESNNVHKYILSINLILHTINKKNEIIKIYRNLTNDIQNSYELNIGNKMHVESKLYAYFVQLSQIIQFSQIFIMPVKFFSLKQQLL